MAILVNVEKAGLISNRINAQNPITEDFNSVKVKNMDYKPVGL